MGAYKYIQEALQKAYHERTEEYRKRIAEWRRQPAIVRIEKPTNIPRARRLGYKAKDYFLIVRVRVKKGLRKRPKPKSGRKARHNYLYLPPQLSKQVMAEQRAARKYRNYEVLNSYYVGEDGQYVWYEVIMIPRELSARKGRAFRLLTSAGRKVRGLKNARTRKRAKKCRK